MRGCDRCGASIDEGARFCSSCGAPQETEGTPASAPLQQTEHTEDAPLPAAGKGEDRAKQPPSSEGEAKVQDLEQFCEKLSTAPYISAAAVLLSVFMPWMTGAGIFHFTMMDMNKVLAFAIIIIGAASAYAAVKRKDYAVSAVMAQGLLLFAVGVFIRYHMVLSEMKKSFIGGMVGNALSLDWGMLLFVVGALGLCAYGTVMYAIEHLRQTGGALTGEVLLCQWKDLIWSKVKLSSIALTGWVYSAAIAALLLFLFF